MLWYKVPKIGILRTFDIRNQNNKPSGIHWQAHKQVNFSVGAYVHTYMIVRVAYRHPPPPQVSEYRPHTTLCTLVKFIKNMTFREVSRLDVEKEMDISVLCWHFRFLKYR